MNRHDYIFLYISFREGVFYGALGVVSGCQLFFLVILIVNSIVSLCEFCDFVSVFIQCTRMCLRVYEFVHVARRVTHLLQATVDVDLIFYIKTFIIWLYRCFIFFFSTFISFQLMYFIHNSLSDISLIAFCI